MHDTYDQSQLLLGCQGHTTRTANSSEAVSYTTMLFLILLVSIFGNTLVCLAIKRFRNLRTCAQMLLFSLAITDFLTPFCRLLYIAVSMAANHWLFGCSWCILTAMLGNFLCAASILHLIAITIERVMVITFPMRYQDWITKRKIVIGLVFIWTLSLIMGLFPLFGVVKMSFNANLMDCEVYLSDNPKLSILLMFSFFILPFSVMIYGHCKMYTIVSTQAQRISLQVLGTPAQRRKIKIEKEWKAAKIVFVVVGTFFMLWVTYFVVTVVKAYYPNSVSGWLLRLSFVLMYSNSCCNWIIYCLMNKPFRVAFKKMLYPNIVLSNLNPFTTRNGERNTRSQHNQVEKETSISPVVSRLSYTGEIKVISLNSPRERKRTLSKLENSPMEVLQEVSSNTERMHATVKDFDQSGGITNLGMVQEITQQSPVQSLVIVTEIPVEEACYPSRIIDDMSREKACKDKVANFAAYSNIDFQGDDIEDNISEKGKSRSDRRLSLEIENIHSPYTKNYIDLDVEEDTEMNILNYPLDIEGKILCKAKCTNLENVNQCYGAYSSSGKNASSSKHNSDEEARSNRNTATNGDILNPFKQSWVKNEVCLSLEKTLQTDLYTGDTSNENMQSFRFESLKHEEKGKVDTLVHAINTEEILQSALKEIHLISMLNRVLKSDAVESETTLESERRLHENNFETLPQRNVLVGNKCIHSEDPISSIKSYDDEAFQDDCDRFGQQLSNIDDEDLYFHTSVNSNVAIFDTKSIEDNTETAANVNDDNISFTYCFKVDNLGNIVKENILPDIIAIDV